MPYSCRAAGYPEALALSAHSGSSGLWSNLQTPLQSTVKQALI